MKPKHALLLLFLAVLLCCAGCGSSYEEEAAFAAYFARNPLDAAFAADSDAQGPDANMAALYGQYAELWQREISYAYQELISIPVSGAGPDTARFNSAYQDWLANQQNLLEEGWAAYQQDSGTVLDDTLRNALAYQFYRDKAYSVYQELYRRCPDYAYAAGAALPEK